VLFRSAAVLQDDGTFAPTKEERIMVPNIGGTMVGLRIAVSTGEYRRGDELWMEQLQPDAYAPAPNLLVIGKAARRGKVIEPRGGR